MGKKSELSGIRARESNRIEFDFRFAGVRYRPTVKRIPNEANLRRAHQQLKHMKTRIERGEFDFADEFPDYRFRTALPTGNNVEALAATATSPTAGRGQLPPLDGGGTGDDYAAEARFATRSAASLRRQLFPSNFSRLPRCIKRSSKGATTTTSPKRRGQSSTGRFEVSTVEDFS